MLVVKCDIDSVYPIPIRIGTKSPQFSPFGHRTIASLSTSVAADWDDDKITYSSLEVLEDESYVGVGGGGIIDD